MLRYGGFSPASQFILAISEYLSWSLLNVQREYVAATPIYWAFSCVICMCSSLEKNFIWITVSWSVHVMPPLLLVRPLTAPRCMSANSRMESLTVFPQVSLNSLSFTHLVTPRSGKIHSWVELDTSYYLWTTKPTTKLGCSLQPLVCSNTATNQQPALFKHKLKST